MKAELMALAVFVAFFGFICTSANPWERADGVALTVISDLTGHGFVPWADSPWQPSLEQRILIFGLGAAAGLITIYSTRLKE